jgi:hypothetical protein
MIRVSGERGNVTLPDWAWGIAMAALVMLLGGTSTAAGWVVTSINDHSRAIERHEAGIQYATDGVVRIEAKVDEVLRYLRQK